VFDVLKRTLAYALFAVTPLFLSVPAFCQDPLSAGSSAVKAHDPSAEEAKILRAAAVSPEFNSSDGPNLRVCLMNSEERQCNTGSFGADRAFSAEAGSSEPSDWIRPAACAADVVALGKVVGQTSALSADEATLITLNNFRIQALYKSKGKTTIGETISALRHGGTLKVPEGVIRQEDLSIPLLAIGTDYILLLRELAGTGGYVSTTDDLDFKALLPSRTEGQAGIEGQAMSLKASGRQDITFDSLSIFQSTLERALAGCAK